MNWYTADTHFGCGLLKFGFRAFPNAKAHDECVISNINRCVGRDDVLRHLGDFGGKTNNMESCLRSSQYRARINCRKIHFIYGNHDIKSIGSCFSTAREVADIKINETPCFLSHYPHVYWPASHYGSLHLYGHVHGRREAIMDVMMPGRRSLDVGIDNAFKLFGEYRPFSENEILDILLARPGHDLLDFYKETI